VAMLSVAERLYRKTVRNEDGCLVWTGWTLRGYGMMNVGGRKGRNCYTHRIAWEMVNGPIPDGMVVDHLCHNHGCLEVTHLRLATFSENQQNRKGAQSDSRTGVRGVTITREGHFRTHVKHKGVQYSAGTFRRIEDADAAVTALRERLHSPIPEIETAR